LRGHVAVALAALAMLATACSPAAGSFSPSGPCDVDGRAPGSYPALEALLPKLLEGMAPTTVDSGRSCSATALGTLVAHDVMELRFAGATWDRGHGSGTSLAVLGLPAGRLPVAWVEEFYEVGARLAKKTDNVAATRPTFEVVGPVFRLDTLNDLSLQTVVVWADGPDARVVIVASPVNPDASRAAHDVSVAAAVAAAAGAPRAATGPGAAGAEADSGGGPVLLSAP
jgi:hypothetical protein